MARTEDGARKRRDDYEDQLSAPIYAGLPEPPYLFSGHQFVMACFRFDPDRFRPFLPSALTLFPDAVANLYLWINSDAGIGIRSCSAALMAVSVNEYPSPDTAEACFIPEGFMSGPPRALATRHYAPFLPGDVEIRRMGDRVEAVLVSNSAEVVRLVLALEGPVRDEVSASDRYFGFDGEGALVTSVVTGMGHMQGARVEGLRLGPGAPSSWQALEPVTLLWGAQGPLFFFSWSVPEPWLSDLPADLGQRRQAMMALFDAQARACVLVSEAGRLQHANAAGQALLAEHALLRQGQMSPPGPDDRRSLLAALKAAAQGSLTPLPLMLTTQGGRRLLVQIVPADPVLAGPGTALVLLSDPAAPPRSLRGDLLLLLGLTPAEARIAATVGAGLPPREAAVRLGLQESTVRSALKVIFDKLGLTRQAELTRLVARLEV